MPMNLDVAIAEALGFAKYSTDGNAMLELDSEMREKGFEVSVSFGNHCGVNKWTAQYFKIGSSWFVARAKTEPLARALAAYKALTGKEWEE